MPFLGNKPTNNFTSFEKQDITGSGTTSYTLAHAVNNEKDIDLYINHVHQEPTTAYSASGTTLTLTESISSSDDCYVLFRSRAIQSATPPDGSVNSAKLATDIAISGDLTVDTSTLKVDSTNNKVGIGTASPSHPFHLVTSTDGTGVSGDDTWAAIIQNAEATDGRSYGLKIMAGSTTDQAFAITDHDGSNNLMIVDGYGHITMPKQSAFSVAKSGHQSNYGTGLITVTFDTERFDQNGDFSANTFTAPVMGRYQLSYNLYMDGLTDDAMYYGSNLVTSNRKYYFIFDPDFGQDAGYWNMNMSLLVEMDAGDTAYVQLEVHSGASGNNDLNGVSTFHGFLAC